MLSIWSGPIFVVWEWIKPRAITVLTSTALVASMTAQIYFYTKCCSLERRISGKKAGFSTRVGFINTDHPHWFIHIVKLSK